MTRLYAYANAEPMHIVAPNDPPTRHAHMAFGPLRANIVWRRGNLGTHQDGHAWEPHGMGRKSSFC